MPLQHRILALVFNDYELLDLMGPLGAIVPRSDYYTVDFVSLTGESTSLAVESTLKNGILTPAKYSIDDVLVQPKYFDTLFIPGGLGVTPLIQNQILLKKVTTLVDLAPNVFTVCTGSLLLAATGRLDGRFATTNKVRFDERTPSYPTVRWKKKARWVVNGKFITSSGITAGLDAAFAFITRTYVSPEDRADVMQSISPEGDYTPPSGHDDRKARDFAHKTARFLEYRWNSDPEDDPFV